MRRQNRLNGQIGAPGKPRPCEPPQSQVASGRIARSTTGPRPGDLSLQTDPIGYKDGLNWYAYVGNDPLNRSDPSGQMTMLDFGARLGLDKDPATPVEPLPVTGRTREEQDKIDRERERQYMEQVRRYLEEEQKKKPPCQSPGPKMRCNANGDLELTPKYNEQVCKNFEALQDGATKSNDGFTAIGVGSMFLKGSAGPIVGGLSTFASFISSTTTGAGYRPFGKVIIPKSDKPPGC